MPAHIKMIGLGSGDAKYLQRGTWEILMSRPRLYLRTKDHPCVALLDQHQIPYQTFDESYLHHQRFEEVYEEIAEKMIELALHTQDEWVYAVPGHPMVAEQSIQSIIAKCKAHQIPYQIVGGESFLDRAFISFGFDPIEGFILLDATQLSSHQIQPHCHMLLTQVYDTYIASDVKMILLEKYPEDTKVYVGHHLGVEGQEIIESIPLQDIDRIRHYRNHSLIWIPKYQELIHSRKEFYQLHEIIRLLRSPLGCPWDRKQTHTSLKKYLIEETYELIDALDEQQPEAICEELGDVLLQVMLHAQIEEEVGTFDVYDVIGVLHDKLIRRHPHVFEAQADLDVEQVKQNWETIKREEKKQEATQASESILHRVPKAIPPVAKAYHLQREASRVGFDWTAVNELLEKVKEELSEVEEVLDRPDAIQEEIGDLLFTVINLARFLKVDPDDALSQTNTKFIQRFTYLEQQLHQRQMTCEDADLQTMQNLWEESKKITKDTIF